MCIITDMSLLEDGMVPVGTIILHTHMHTIARSPNIKYSLLEDGIVYL